MSKDQSPEAWDSAGSSAGLAEKELVDHADSANSICDDDMRRG